MQTDEPAYLSAGTEVSARFKGAFCEAKVISVLPSARCKVQLKTPPFQQIYADHFEIRGFLKVNQTVSVVRGKESVKGIIQSIRDNSIYVVDFNDGDIRQLRRANLNVKDKKSVDERTVDTAPSTSVETSRSAASANEKNSEGQRRKISRKAFLLKSSDNCDITYGENDDVDVELSSDIWSDRDESTTVCSTSSEDIQRQRSRTSRSRRTRALNTPTSSRPCSRQARRHSQSHTYMCKNNNEHESAGSDCKSPHQCTNVRHLSRPQSHNRSASRLIAEKILTKSIARTRKKRYAATAAAAALKHVKDSSSSGEEATEKGSIISDDILKDGLKSIRVRLKKKFTHTSEEDSESSTMMKKGNRNRRNKESDEEVNKKTKHKELPSGLKKVYKVGSIVAAYEDTTRRGKWIPSVIVTEKAYFNNTKGSTAVAKNDVCLKSFKDGKYFICSMCKLSYPGQSVLTMPDVCSKIALDRATAYCEEGILPSGWLRQHIYDSSVSPRKDEDSTASHDSRKRNDVDIIKKENDEESASSDDSSECSNYDEKRDRFIARLYNFHDEKGTPINRAPILGGKDIDMFRLYNVVERLGGRKKVNEKSAWKTVLHKMHLEGCQGATPATLRQAYQRYLNDFSIACRNFGSSQMILPEIPNSERSARLMERRIAQGQRRKNAALRAKGKEKSHRGSNEAAKGTKNEKEKDTRKRASIKRDDKEQLVAKPVSAGDSFKSDELSLSPQSRTSALAERDNSEEKTSRSIEKAASDSGVAGLSIERGKDIEESEKVNVKKEKEQSRSEDSSHSPHDTESRKSESRKKKDKKESKLAGGRSHAANMQKSPSGVSSGSNHEGSTSEDGERAHVGHKKEKRKKVDQKGVRERKEGEGSMKKEKSREVVPLDKCVPATVLTDFRMGQDLKAYHHGQWYDARVISLGKQSHNDVLSSMMEYEARCKAITESSESSDKGKENALLSADEWLHERLENILREMRCCVHYLGWNARYDEWIEHIKIKVHEKDQKFSEEMFVNSACDKVSPSTVTAALAWRSAVDPSTILVPGTTGLRPRRLSHNQEKLESGETFSKHERSRSRTISLNEKRTKKRLAPSASPTLTGALISTSSEAGGFLKESHVLDVEERFIIYEPRTDEIKIQSTSVIETVSELITNETNAKSGKPLPEEIILQIKNELELRTRIPRTRTSSEVYDVSSTADSIPPKRTRSVFGDKTSNEGVDPTDLFSSYLKEPTRRIISTLDEVATIESDTTEAFIQACSVDEHASTTIIDNKNVVDENAVLTESTIMDMESVQLQTQLDANIAPIQLAAVLQHLDANSDKQETKLVSPRNKESSPTDVSNNTLASPCRDSISMESEALAEEALADDETGNYPSMVAGWHPPMAFVVRQGRRGKRRKLSTSYSITEQRKVAKSEERENGQESSHEDEGPCVKDSWHAFKTRIQQKVDAENAECEIDYEKELGFAPLDESLTGEALVQALQERMQDLRDLYHTVKCEQAHLDRKFRKSFEKRKQREKELRKKDEDSSLNCDCI